jgi:hypothetical protein
VKRKGEGRLDEVGESTHGAEESSGVDAVRRGSAGVLDGGSAASGGSISGGGGAGGDGAVGAVAGDDGSRGRGSGGDDRGLDGGGGDGGGDLGGVGGRGSLGSRGRGRLLLGGVGGRGDGRGNATAQGELARVVGDVVGLLDLESVVGAVLEAGGNSPLEGTTGGSGCRLVSFCCFACRGGCNVLVRVWRVFRSVERPFLRRMVVVTSLGE